MKRLLQKKIIIPIKHKIARQKRIQDSKLRSIKEIWEMVEQKEKEKHQAVRKSDKNKENNAIGFIQALKWVCQEQKESKQ